MQNIVLAKIKGKLFSPFKINYAAKKCNIGIG